LRPFQATRAASDADRRGSAVLVGQVTGQKACHCTGCQRMSASAFSLSLAIPAPGFEAFAGLIAELAERGARPGPAA